jgi:energy-coupling factor transporter ATP-binding protein EcfA2
MAALLEVHDLKKYFKARGGAMLHAVDGINFSLDTGKTLGVVGESGCGKSTLGRTILHLLDATGGQVLFEGRDITNPTKNELHRIRQLAADHLVHGWDLAAAIDGDTRMDPHLVTEVARWFGEREELYRSAGLVGPRAPLGGDAQTNLLAAFGRRAHWGRSHAALVRFSNAFGAGDVDAIMSLMTDDCVFEATSPPPDGSRHEGAAAVRRVWEELFTGTAGASFSEEEAFVCDDRGVLRWRFDWTDPDGSPGHVRGVDVLRFRDGKVCEKLSYVKG